MNLPALICAFFAFVIVFPLSAFAIDFIWGEIRLRSDRRMLKARLAHTPRAEAHS